MYLAITERIYCAANVHVLRLNIFRYQKNTYDYHILLTKKSPVSNKSQEECILQAVCALRIAPARIISPHHKCRIKNFRVTVMLSRVNHERGLRKLADGTQLVSSSFSLVLFSLHACEQLLIFEAIVL